MVYVPCWGGAAPNKRGHKAMMLSDVCLSVWRLTSVAYIKPKSRTERPGKIKTDTEVAHVTHDLDTTFKVKRSRSPGRFTHRRVNASGSCSGERGNVLAVGLLLRCSLLGGVRRFGAHRRRRGRAHIVAAARLQLVSVDSAANESQSVCGDLHSPVGEATVDQIFSDYTWHTSCYW